MPSSSRPTLTSSATALLDTHETALDRQALEIVQTQIDIRRHLHAHPEPSEQEVETSRYLFDLLESAGFEPKLGRDGLGVWADIELGHCDASTPVIALRADMDALRIQDAKPVPYASTREGVCHACGHDAHSAMVLGAALTSRAMQSDFDASDTRGVRLRFLFQPAEETAVGARWMVEQGAIDGVAAILGLHVDPERTLGTVGIRYGTMTANCDEIELQVTGTGGHSARPHHTNDPIAAAANLVSTLYQFLPRSVDSRSPSVFSIGRLAGGTLPNVIPDKVEIRGSLRTTSDQTRTVLKDRIEAIIHGVKEATGTTIHFRFLTPIDAVDNDPVVTAALEEAARRVVGIEGLTYIDRPSMGGEDFSAYLSRVPGAMIRIGCAPPGFAAPFLHAPDFDIDERTLQIGSRILLRAALILVAEPGGQSSDRLIAAQESAKR